MPFPGLASGIRHMLIQGQAPKNLPCKLFRVLFPFLLVERQ